MKTFRHLILTAAVLASSVGVGAQTVERKLIAEERIEFAPHWFMQIQGGAAQTLGEASFGDLISPAAALNFGYKFSPLFSLRFGASGWQAKGAWVSPFNVYKYKYVQGNVDAMLSLTNLFCGWNPTRTLDFYGFLGVGGANTFDNDEAESLQRAGADFEYLWTGNKWFVTGRGGLGVNIRLSDYVGLNIEANANMYSDHFNSKRGGGSNLDWQFNGLIGLNIKFGRGYKKIDAVYEEIVIEEPAPAPKPVEPKPEPKPVPVVVKAQPMTQNIFFLINSAKIRTSEQVKVEKLIEYLKANPNAKVQITGYADKETGTAPYNMKLSGRRADAVAKALVDGGIAESRISVKADGDTVQPFPGIQENRVAIAIAEDK